MKKCAKCEKTKNHTEFNKAKTRKDGFRPYCRDCESCMYKKYMLGDRAKKLLLVRAEKYRKSTKGIKAAKKFKSSEKYKKYLLEYSRRSYKNTEQRKKINCRNMTNYFISVGKIEKKPCEICGSIKSQAHHHDYSKPKDVIFLCAQHHTDEHRRNI